MPSSVKTPVPPPPPPPPPSVPHQGVSAPVRPDRLRATSTRDLAAAMPAVRMALLTTLRQAELTVTVEQLAVVEAERGSRLGGLTLSPEKLPVTVRAELEPMAEGCRLRLSVEDDWKIPGGRNFGAVGAYRTLFEALTQRLDRALAGLGPSEFAWDVQLGDDANGFQGVSGAAARAHQVVGRSKDKILDGGGRRATSAASGFDSVELAAPNGVVELDGETVVGMLTTGRLVVDRPGGMPPHLVADVQRFVIALEEHLDRAAASGMNRMTRMEVEASQVPVVGFLFQQARLREQLPLRLLTTCTTCKLEKVVNPDLAKMRDRARRSQALTSSMGMFLGRGGVSPYVMLGRMAHLKKTEPDYVCPRCQGLDADECVVTFCPSCGERRDEAVLRACPRCNHDFRRLDPSQPDWHEATPVAPVPVAAVVAPAALPAPAGQWARDPWGRADERYYDGTTWTPHVRRGGVVGLDHLA